jgi:hypothetical protein
MIRKPDNSLVIRARCVSIGRLAEALHDLDLIPPATLAGDSRQIHGRAKLRLGPGVSKASRFTREVSKASRFTREVSKASRFNCGVGKASRFTYEAGKAGRFTYPGVSSYPQKKISPHRFDEGRLAYKLAWERQFKTRFPSDFR